jgi:hypothetical protein
LIDFDFKALYPSEIHQNNIAPNTLIGKIEIDKKVYEHENVYNKELYVRGGEFIENMITDNYIEFCHRWFGLANFKEFINDMDEYFRINGIGDYSDLENNVKSPIVPTTKFKVRSPITFANSRSIKACYFYNSRNKEITYESLMESK